jgi:DDE superfamily endonuclease
MAFLNWATSHQILVLILPPHSTHRLQPLDVGLFQPLAMAYTKQLNKLTFEG